MQRVDVFTARDLRNNAGGLLRDAAAGRLSLITKHGRPAALAMPFGGQLLEQGVHRRLALHLFEQRLVTLAQAAKIAGISIDELLDLLSETDIAAVDYPPGELVEELGNLK